MTVLNLNLAIPPHPKGRPRFSRNGHTYTSPKDFAHEMAIRRAWETRHGVNYGRCTCPISVRIEFETERPKSIKVDRPWTMRNKGDVDNLAKSVLDALNGMAWVDDCQIVELTVVKRPQTAFSQNAIRIEVTYHN